MVIMHISKLFKNLFLFLSMFFCGAKESAEMIALYFFFNVIEQTHK